MFTNRLQALGITKTIIKTRLKDDIMGTFLGHCVEETDGKNTILVFKQGLKNCLKINWNHVILRVKLYKHQSWPKPLEKKFSNGKKPSFNGHFSPNGQSESVPPLLISIIINGQDVAVTESSADSQAF